MKLFATTLNADNVVILHEFPTLYAFDRFGGDSADPRWIAVATSAELDYYRNPYESELFVFGDERVASYDLLHEQYKLRGKYL